MKSQLLGARAAGMEALAHDPRPQAPRRPELGDLLEKIVVSIEEEGKPLTDLVDVETGVDGGLHVGDRVGECERHLLNGGRARLADVIAADRDGVPVGHLALAEREDVGHDPQRRSRRKDIGAARDVFLQDVVLDGAGERPDRHILPPRHRRVQGEQDDRGRVDRHGCGDAIQRDALEQPGHVVKRIDCDAHPADLAGGQRVVGVVPHLRGQVERDAQPADAMTKQVAIARIRLFGRRKPGVLAHRPQTAAVHGRLNAASERVFTGKAERGRRILAGEVAWTEGAHESGILPRSARKSLTGW